MLKTIELPERQNVSHTSSISYSRRENNAIMSLDDLRTYLPAGVGDLTTGLTDYEETQISIYFEQICLHSSSSGGGV